MSATLTIIDQDLTGTVDRRFELTFPTESITVRELIRERVYQEVDDYNRSQRDGFFEGLVQPSEAETERNGFRIKRGREIQWKPQYEHAIDAYERNRILVLVNDRQTESLDETVEIGHGTEVTFLRLVMLVGG
ncbi:MAG: hypothetical protein KF757_13985 [Phycisphaeraceae bacterium]|nr:hypothetical protein [Phycisphaeraceae bacterium]MCW5764072.1 hypothetical protein [Phycisphaeraceae bacterium]